MAALTIIRFLFRLKDVDATNIADGFVLVARPDGTQPSGFIHEYEAQAGGGGGPPNGPAGGVLDGTYPNPGLAASVAGSGLAEAADVLSVNVDNSTIEIAADTLQVKDGGITPTKLSFDPATQAELDAHINDPTDAHMGTAIGNTPAGGIAATTAQGAINELDTEKANIADAVMDGDAAGGVLSGTYPNPGFAVDMATQAELDAVAASAVLDGDAAGGVLSGTYPNPGFAVDMATQAELDAHINDPTDAHAGTAIGNTPAGGIGSTTVQGAINELDSEKVSTATFDDHSARHENGGADEISVAGLSGELADAQPVTVRKNTGADVGTRSRLNFIEGSNVTLTVTDDAGSDEVDITIAAAAGGGSNNLFNWMVTR